MAKTLAKCGWVRRLSATAAIVIGFGAVGCAFPHGQYGGDPMLGAFNRPIAPTPGIERGGPGGLSPAHDGGARLGINPDVSIYSPVAGAAGGSYIAPTGEMGGFQGMFRGVSESSTPIVQPTGRPMGQVGARLQSLRDTEVRPMVVQPRTMGSFTNLPARDSVSMRDTTGSAGLISGASFQPQAAPHTPTVVYDSHRTGKQMTVEDAQIQLSSYTKWHRLEQSDNGEWICSAGLIDNPAIASQKRYEVRHASQLEAVRGVMEQIKSDKSSQGR